MVMSVLVSGLSLTLFKAPDGQGILGFQNWYLLLGANID